MREARRRVALGTVAAHHGTRCECTTVLAVSGDCRVAGVVREVVPYPYGPRRPHAYLTPHWSRQDKSETLGVRAIS
jgi:hypothetical protein